MIRGSTQDVGRWCRLCWVRRKGVLVLILIKWGIVEERGVIIWRKVVER